MNTPASSKFTVAQSTIEHLRTVEHNLASLELYEQASTALDLRQALEALPMRHFGLPSFLEPRPSPEPDDA